MQIANLLNYNKNKESVPKLLEEETVHMLRKGVTERVITHTHTQTHTHTHTHTEQHNMHKETEIGTTDLKMSVKNDVKG